MAICTDQVLSLVEQRRALTMELFRELPCRSNRDSFPVEAFGEFRTRSVPSGTARLLVFTASVVAKLLVSKTM